MLTVEGADADPCGVACLKCVMLDRRKVQIRGFTSVVGP